MRKFLGLTALGLCLAVVAVPSISQLDAQVKDSKGKAKVEEKKSAVKLGTIEVYMAKDGFRYRIKDSDGKTIAMSARGQDKKEDVLSDLNEIKETLNKVKPTEIKD